MLFERDERGTPIPKSVKLQGTDEDIVITPLTRAEFLKYFKESQGGETSKDQDFEIIKDHLKEPLLTEAEIHGIKPAYATAIVSTIMVNSGLKLEKEGETPDGLKDFTGSEERKVGDS